MIAFNDCGATVRADVEATRRLYAAMDTRDRDACDCEQCIHFITNRSAAYRPEFRKLLDRLGIDETKESDLCGVGDPRPEYVLYLGSFEFVGSVEQAAPGNRAAGNKVAYGDYEYHFWNVGAAARAQKLADQLGVGPIASIVFTLWLPVPFSWAPD